MVGCVVVLAWSTHHFWTPAVARALVCEQNGEGGDAILVDHFESNYLLFERAGEGDRVALTDLLIDGDVEVMLEIAGTREPTNARY